MIPLYAGGGHQGWRQLRAFDHLEMEFLFSSRRVESNVERNHGWSRSRYTHHRGWAVLRQRSNRSAGGYNFRGSRRRSQGHHHVCAGERHCNFPEAKERMPAGQNPVVLDHGDSAAGTDREVAAHQIESNHVARLKVLIVRRRRSRASGHRRHAPRRKNLAEFVPEFPGTTRS